MTNKPLEGIKVVDLSYIIAGPLCTSILGDFGAQVVAVENPYSLTLRSYIPYVGGKPGIESSTAFLTVYSSKYSLLLNLRKPQGVEVAKRLVKWADVVVEQFPPGTLERLGLGYKDLKKINPDIVMISNSSQGQTGPYATLASFGLYLTGLTGLNYITGWPDRTPTGPLTPYPDYVCGYLMVSLILAALNYRQRTGKGQHIDLSMVEATCQMATPLLLDYVVNGREQERNGNRLDRAVPHNAYRCQGDDRWCVITIFTDEEWSALCKVMGDPEWASDTKFATSLSRKENEDELDKLIEAWTVNYSPEQLTIDLQKAGIAAAVTYDFKDMFEDKHLWERGFLQTKSRSEIGEYYVSGPSFQMSETPAELRSAPLLGQDNEHVCTTLLGMSDMEFAELVASGTFAGD